MTNTKPKIAAVFGGAGFLGSHLCERLLEDGYQVICIDNFSCSGQGNISHLLQRPNFEFIRADVTEPIDLEAIPDLNKFQIPVFGLAEIYNLAVPTSVRNFDKFKLAMCLANFEGTKNTLDLAVKYKSKYMFFSSQVIYGNYETGDYVKEDVLDRPTDHLSERACYDEGKRYAETLVNTYREVFGLDTKIVRVFRTYGPRMLINDSQMISDFIIAALENKDLVIHGDENFRTSLVYVSDVIEGCVKLMATTNNGPINLGGPEVFKVVDVAKKIIELTNSQSQITYAEKLLFLREGAFPDITKIREEIGWFPLITLEDGLRKTIDYTEAHKDLLVSMTEV